MSESDMQQVVDALLGILSIDKDVRTAASDFLTQYASVDGYLEMLLQLAHDDQQLETLRIGAATQFKAVVSARWSLKAGLRESEKYLEVKEEEKASLRGNILGALVTNVVPIRNLLEDALRVIISHDYPERWANLPELILGALNTDSLDQIVAALIALRGVLKKYDSVANVDRRAEAFTVADATFPILKDLFAYLLQNDSAGSQEVQHLILKVFWDGTMYGLPMCLREHEFFDGWIQLMLATFSIQVPHTENMDQHTFNKLAWWGTKKMVLLNWIRMCNRFMRNSAIRGDDSTDFRAWFVSIYPSLFLDKTFEALSLLSQGVKWPQRSLVTLLDFLYVALSFGALWQQLKPHVWDIIKSVLVPLLFFNEEDAYTFEFEPDMYISNQLDPLCDETNPRSPAMTFIHDLAKRREAVWLQDVVAYILTELFRPYQAASTIEEKLALANVKFAGLDILGTLNQLLNESEVYKSSIGPLLAEHVVPDMVDAPAWLRAKACWTFSRFCRMEFDDQDMLLAGLDGMLKCLLESEELPLVADAAVALFDLIPNKTVRPVLGPLVPQIVAKYLALMERVDNDAIVGSLQLLMRYFPRPMQKSAVHMITRLSNAFLRADHNSNQINLGDDTDADNAFMAASQTIRAIHTLYKSIRKSPTLYEALEPQLMPVLEISLSRAGSSYLEDALALMTEFTYFTPAPFSAALWHKFDMLCAAYMSFAPDYMQTILPSLDNFISRDPQTFLSNPKYLEQICAFATKYFVDPKYPELDLLPLTRVFEVLLLEHMGSIDHIIEPLLKLTVDRIVMGGSNPILVVLLQLVMNCMYYNASITCHWLEANGVTQNILKLLFDLIINDEFVRICDKKAASLGIGAMLRLPMAQLPAYVQEKFLEIVATYMQLTQQAEEQRIAEAEDEEDEEFAEEEFEEEGMEEEEDDDMDWGEELESDVEDDEDEEALEQALAMMKAENEEDLTQDDVNALIGKARNIEDDEDLPDGYGPANGLTERFLDAQDHQWTLLGQEASEELPTEDIHEIVFLAETFEALDPAVSQQLQASFNPEMKELYEKLMEVANDKVAKAQFEAERKAAKEAKNAELREYYQSLQQ